jgi:uncharacterized protein YyaL (SSP411 family)
MIRGFADENAEGVFYDTQHGHGDLFVRPRDTSDSVKPCGASAAADVLLRLATVTGNPAYERHALAALNLMRPQLAANPLVCGNWLSLVDLHLSGPEEIVVVGSIHDPRTQELTGVIHQRYMPNKIIVGVEPGQPHTPEITPLIENRTAIDECPTAYLCHRHTCQSPTSDPEALRRQLESH